MLAASAARTEADRHREAGGRYCPRVLPDSVTAAADRPLLRGVLHQAAFFLSLAAGTLLVFGAHGERRTTAAAVFAGSVSTCFGASALFHRVRWTPSVRVWMGRVDHAGIYLLIAGTYTPVALLALRGAWRPAVLSIIWTGAAAAIVLKFTWITAPRWLAPAIGITLGWAAVVALPQLAPRLNAAGLALLLLGGLAYTAGALVYARRQPDPRPTVFGYHELFHGLTVIAATLQYTAIAFFVVKAG